MHPIREWDFIVSSSLTGISWLPAAADLDVFGLAVESAREIVTSQRPI